jgi:CRP-like cAMP-binding protein
MGCGQANANAIEPHHQKYHAATIRHHKPINPDQITEAVDISTEKPTEEQLRFAVSNLSQHQLFGTLNKKELRIIAQEMVVATPLVPKGYIFRQGELGTCFFLIYSGSVDIEIDGKVVRTLRKGETFGELALLFRSPRTASIKAKTNDCQFLVVKPLVYKKTLKKMRIEEQLKNSETIEKVPLFSCLTNKQKHALSNTIKISVFNAGEVIFRTGDDAQVMFIISEGHVRISI